MIKEINILGVIYRVNEADVVDKGDPCKGRINYLTNEIRIDKWLVQSAKEQTLMHEILHAVFDLLGLDELNADENKVQSIATALHHVFTSQTIFESPQEDNAYVVVRGPYGRHDKLLRVGRDGSKALQEEVEKMEWRRFELLTGNKAEEERLERLLAEKNLSRQDLAVILFGLRVRPGFEKEDFGI